MEEACESEKMNGDETKKSKEIELEETEKETVYGVLKRLIAVILFPEPNSSVASTPLLQRAKMSVNDNWYPLRQASTHSGRNLLLWTRRGGPLRALLVISVGTITLLTLTGLLVFMLFFLAATVNAIIVSLLVSLAVAGGFLALFFACVTAIYIGALSVASFVISTATISAIVAVMIATGWIGFLCIVWLATKKSLGLAKHSLSMTSSALSAYTSAQRSHHPNELNKVAG